MKVLENDKLLSCYGGSVSTVINEFIKLFKKLANAIFIVKGQISR